MKPEEVLQEVADQTRVCTRCKLHHSRKNAVPGVGNPYTKVMFIGEGPGFHENEQGLPFVGAAGKFLDELLGDAGLAREGVFITNVVKCRPPGNRDPQPDELDACRGYLEKQIAAINPLVIVTLGRFSMARYFENSKISAIHGQPAWRDERLIVPMYHPAAGLHQPNLKPTIIKDFSHLAEMVERARKEHSEKSARQDEQDTQVKNSSTQLSLF